MIKVCDSIMGSGKTQATMDYMWKNKDEKFIYITPYLEETDRIMNGLSGRSFMQPARISKYNYRKTDHTAALIKQGRNIVTTHEAFKRYTMEMLSDIRNQGYTLIIDEDTELLRKVDQSFNGDAADIQLLLDAGYICETNGKYKGTEKIKKYKGGKLDNLVRSFEVRDIEICASDSDYKQDKMYWVFSPEFMLAFKEVIVLTYILEAQSIYHFFNLYDIQYELIGVRKNERSFFRYEFCEYPGETPEYVSTLPDKIHIIMKDKLNNFEKDTNLDRCALSDAWLLRNRDGASQQVRRNISNCFKNIWKGIPPENRMWSTTKRAEPFLKDAGYRDSFVPYNTKATNQYRNKTHLAYAINVYMNVDDKEFYKEHGVEVNEDAYALSTMIQWVWRSAIRDGNPINIYIPSTRMRNLFIEWIDRVSKGGDAFVG